MFPENIEKSFLKKSFQKRNNNKISGRDGTLSTLFPTSIFMQSLFVEFASISLVQTSDKFEKLSLFVTSYTRSEIQSHYTLNNPSTKEQDEGPDRNSIGKTSIRCRRIQIKCNN